MNPPASKPAAKPSVASPPRKAASRPTPPPRPDAVRPSEPPAAPATPATAAPKKPAAPTPSASGRKKAILIGAAAAAVVAVGVFLYAQFFGPVEAPRLNSEPYVIGKFTATRDFDRLDFAKKWQYYELLDDKEDALKAAYTEGKMTDDEYRIARQAAWYGKHLGRMKNYFETAPGRERDAYLDKQVLKKYEDKDDKGDGKSAGGSDGQGALTADEIKRDDSEEEGDISAWPAEVRAKWDEYRAAYGARKDRYKLARDAEKARKDAPVAAPVRVPGR